MSSMMAVLDSDGTLVGADELTREVRENVTQARDDRKRYEPTWHSNLAFASGKYWFKWDAQQRQLVFPTELFGRELYSSDVITEYRTTALGELGSDDDRPELLLRRNDQPSEDFQRQLNRAVAWGWDSEWRGDDVLQEVRRLCLDLGTAAVRCRFDPTVGPIVADNVPHVNGKPLMSQQDAVQALSNGPDPNIEMKAIHRGRICWEPLSAFNLIVPPGIPHEAYFPWECVVRPVRLVDAQEEFGAVMAGIKEDSDIGSLLGLDTQSDTTDVTALGMPTAGKTARLKGHVWLFTYYERPTPKYENGRTVSFVGNRMKPVRVLNQLPYCDPTGAYCSGIVYFHWWRVSGRFWSRALVEAMKDPQRLVNKRRTQSNEIIDRGLPVVFVEKNSPAKERRGLPMEVIEIGAQERAPQPTQGIGPGEWMYRDVEASREDLEHATGIRGPRLGENPQNVTTYAQLALLNENDQVKRSMIQSEHKSAIGKLVEASVYDIRTYWGDREIEFVDEDEQVDAFMFNATRTPAFFIVKVAKGATKPRSQGAELKKIEEIWNGVVVTQAFLSDPHAWINWLKGSLEAGQALELPDSGSDKDADKAELENHLMIVGQDMPVQYYDPAAVHIPIHREAQIQAELTNNLELWTRIEKHVQQHVLVTASTAHQLAQMAPPPMLPTEGVPGAPQQGQGQPAQPQGPQGPIG